MPVKQGVGDHQLDRFDVAVRSVVRVATRGRRTMQAEVGLSVEQCAQVVAAELDLDHSLRTEAGVFELLQACPFLLDHALTLLLRYHARSLDLRDALDLRDLQQVGGR